METYPTTDARVLKGLILNIPWATNKMKKILIAMIDASQELSRAVCFCPKSKLDNFLDYPRVELIFLDKHKFVAVCDQDGLCRVNYRPTGNKSKAVKINAQALRCIRIIKTKTS